MENEVLSAELASLRFAMEAEGRPTEGLRPGPLEEVIERAVAIGAFDDEDAARAFVAWVRRGGPRRVTRTSWLDRHDMRKIAHAAAWEGVPPPAAWVTGAIRAGLNAPERRLACLLLADLVAIPLPLIETAAVRLAWAARLRARQRRMRHDLIGTAAHAVIGAAWNTHPAHHALDMVLQQLALVASPMPSAIWSELMHHLRQHAPLCRPDQVRRAERAALAAALTDLRATLPPGLRIALDHARSLDDDPPMRDDRRASQDALWGENNAPQPVEDAVKRNACTASDA